MTTSNGIKRHPIQIIQGGQYGSESKGSIAAYYAIRDNIDFAVRTGATNAGHVVVYGGERCTMQQLPCGWVNPKTALVVGAGALVDLDILAREIAQIQEVTGYDPRPRVYIDARAYIHRREHQERSAASGRHHAMGATGKGCSEALIDRVRERGAAATGLSSSDVLNTIGHNRGDGRLRGVNIADTERLLNNAWDQGARIQLEGTQGQLLDLALGPYPYTTHKQTGPAQWMVEAGLSPSLPVQVILVVRTFPIRVAGNSGPMPNEITWPMLAREINQRLEQVGDVPLIAESALANFEDALVKVGDRFNLPPGLYSAVRQHLWTTYERVTYREALSELNAAALALVAGESPDTLVELKKLFEMTTVTKKLRRIARIDLPTLMNSARQARPAQVAVTFMNYVCPEMWGSDKPLVFAESAFLSNVSHACQAPVTLINRGPLPAHIVECDVPVGV